MDHVLAVKLERTDTTLDLSQKAEKSNYLWPQDDLSIQYFDISIMGKNLKKINPAFYEILGG